VAIRPAHVETAFVENDLDFPDLIRAQLQRRSSAAAETCAAARANRHDRDDLPAVVDDHDVIAHDEVLMPAPSRIDLDQRRRHVNEAHARRHHGPDAQRKVDIVHARHVAAGENGLPNCRALLRVEGHVASLSLALLRLTLLRLLLVLARLRLPSRLLLLGLTALLRLPLLALSTLRLAGAALLVACSCRAAFGLRAALGTGLAG